MARVLIGCEESQVVCCAFRELGIEAFSCDIQDCSGGHPEWHIKDDAIKIAYDLNYKWDLMIAHPPCTYMSKAGARWMYLKAGVLNTARYEQAIKAREFFLKLLNAPIEKIAIENPVPLRVVSLPQYSQSIQPYEYGHEYSKKTLLWLINLPLLIPSDIKGSFSPYLPSNTGGAKRGQSHNRGVSRNAKESSKTFPGIAKAMAEQWGKALCDTETMNENLFN